MYAQSKRLTEPVLPQDLSSSSTPIDCELVGNNGCIWSKDVHNVSKSQSQICEVIRTSRDKYSSMVAKSVIAHDQESNKESSIPSSSPSIIPCAEATSLAVLSVNDEVNESMNTVVQGEEGEEEDNYEVDDDVLARECALLVEGVSDDDDEYVYVPEECSHITTTIADGNSNDNGNGNVSNDSVNNNNNSIATSKQDSLHDSSANTITAITTTSMSVEEDQPIRSSPNIALPSHSINDNGNDNDNNACNNNADKDVQESANKDAGQERKRRIRRIRRCSSTSPPSRV